MNKPVPTWQKPWVMFVYQDNQIVHVVPVDDIKQHDVNDCKCVPRNLSPLPDIPIYLHNSWDGREAVDAAEKILERAWNKHYNNRNKKG